MISVEEFKVGITFKTLAQKLWPMTSVYLASSKAPRFMQRTSLQLLRTVEGEFNVKCFLATPIHCTLINYEFCACTLSIALHTIWCFRISMHFAKCTNTLLKLVLRSWLQHTRLRIFYITIRFVNASLHACTAHIHVTAWSVTTIK